MVVESNSKSDSGADVGTDAAIQERLRQVKEKGWYRLRDDSYLLKALEYEPLMSPERLGLWLALYRMNPPKLLQQIEVPCMLMYGTHLDVNAKKKQHIDRQITRLQKLRPEIQFLPVAGGHYVHWSSENTVKEIGRFIREHD